MHDTGIIVWRVVRIDGLPLLFKKGVFPTWKKKRKKEKNGDKLRHLSLHRRIEEMKKTN